MEYKDYYSILSVDKETGADDVKKAYRKLARKYHPDVNPGDKEAEKRFKEITEAQAVLADPEKKAKYERLAESWQAFLQAGGAGDFDWSWWIHEAGPDGGAADVAEALHQAGQRSQASGFSDFFEAVFGGLAEAGPVTPSQGRDYNQKLEISLEEAFNGTARILKLGGRRIEVKIPRGAKSGTKVRVRGEGAEGEGGGPKGDLYLEIEVTPHEFFERIGEDLYTDLPVDLYTAILGGEAIVTTFRGKIKLKIPPETQSGRTFRLKGQGMPQLKQPDERGDLLARVVVQLPQNLTPQEIELFEELADLRGL